MKMTEIPKNCAALFSREDLNFYFTKFHSTFGYTVVDSDGAKFYTDPRYLEAAAPALAKRGIACERYTSLRDIVSGYSKLYVPMDYLTYPEYKSLSALCKLCDCTAELEDAMAVKDEEELSLIKDACRVAEDALAETLKAIKEGMTEQEFAAELEYRMRLLGAEKPSFDTIVAFGKNSSVPHHETGETKLCFGDVLLVDFGAKVGGYCSDCTRTYLFGDDQKHEDFKKTYEIVLQSHMEAKEKIASGMTGREADKIARDYLEKYDLSKFFTHSLGHGMGINIHEAPYLSPSSKHVLRDGMVFSNEPGVYFEGSYGIRIEDTELLTGGKCQNLTYSDKNLIIL